MATSVQQPVTIGLSDTLTGALGAQSWGGLSVSASGWSGTPALVTRTADGLGVDGGRFAGQLDYNPATGSSEALRLDFAAPVDSLTLRLSRLSLTDGVGKAEVGGWRAFDAAGVLVAQGILDPRGKTAVASNTYDFTIDPAADFQRIELFARPYNNDPTQTGTADSSDFSLAQLSYVPAAPAVPPGLVVTESGGTTIVAEGGATDAISIALASRPTANVTVTLSGSPDLALAGGAAGAAATLTFTPLNWNVAQTIALSAVNDTLLEGSETARLTLAASSPDSAYAMLPAQNLSVAIADNDTGPIIIGAAAALSGPLGAQSWGGLAVSALSWSGAAALVTKTQDGLGVDAGRFTGQVDYNPGTRTSEVLRLDFAEQVDSATLRLSRMSLSDGVGKAEVGAWRAFDAAGGLVGEGVLDPRRATAVASNTYEFLLDPVSDFRRVEITARPYNNDATQTGTKDSSDFSLAQVSYMPAVAAPPVVAVPGLAVVETGGTTTVTEGGPGDTLSIALASQPSADVIVTALADADLALGAAGSAVLTFTPLNWNTPQTLAVGAVNDTLVEGAETARLVLDISSADAGYNALPDRVIAVGVTDNDTQGAPPGAVIVKLGADIQALVDANPANTVFWIEAGEHRLQSITPKAGQHFIGAEGAILNGSRELSGLTASGSTWYVGGQTQEGWRQGTSEGTSGFARAGYPDAVYLDDKPLLHVGSVQDVRPGTYFFDYAADRIYIGDNPSGHQVEAAVRDFAFKGGATGVTVENLIVEKYATPAQFGAIGGTTRPVDWLIKDNEVRLNYGVGIHVGDGTKVIGNLVHDNGQMGVGANGDGVLFEGNEIATNGFWSGLNVYWEGGGSKFALTDGLVVRGNYVHDNNGMGLWTDVNNIRTLYEGNRVVNNSGAGISHEISYDAIIRNNTLINNGQPGSPWLWNAGIQIQNSSNVEVYANVVDMTHGANGIALIQQQRGSGEYGPWLTNGNNVHDNVVIAAGGNGRSGAVADYDWAGMKAGGNVFDNNEYRVANAAEDHFAFNYFYDWNTYRAQSGWDAHSDLVLI